MEPTSLPQYQYSDVFFQQNKQGVYPDLTEEQTERQDEIDHLEPKPEFIPVFTSEKSNDLQQLLAKAWEVANRILPQEKTSPFNPELSESSESPHIEEDQSPKEQPARSSGSHGSENFYFFDFSNRSTSWFSRDTYVAPVYSDRSVEVEETEEQEKRRKEKEETNTRIIIGVMALFAMVGSVFYIGKYMSKEFNRQEEEQLQRRLNEKSFEALKINWEGNKKQRLIGIRECFPEKDNYKTLVDQIVQCTDNILKGERRDYIHKMILLAGTFVAGTTAFAGAWTKSRTFMKAGVLMGIGVTIAAVFKLSYRYFSKSAENNAQAIFDKSEQLGNTKQIPVVE